MRARGEEELREEEKEGEASEERESETYEDVRRAGKMAAPTRVNITGGRDVEENCPASCRMVACKCARARCVVVAVARCCLAENG